LSEEVLKRKEECATMKIKKAETEKSHKVKTIGLKDLLITKIISLIGNFYPVSSFNNTVYYSLPILATFLPLSNGRFRF